MKYPHLTYVIEQPFGGFGRAYQAVCERCGVLIHVNDRRAAEAEAWLHGRLCSDEPLTEPPPPPMTPDQLADAAHEARARQRKIESELAG